MAACHPQQVSAESTCYQQLVSLPSALIHWLRHYLSASFVITIILIARNAHTVAGFPVCLSPYLQRYKQDMKLNTHGSPFRGIALYYIYPCSYMVLYDTVVLWTVWTPWCTCSSRCFWNNTVIQKIKNVWLESLLPHNLYLLKARWTEKAVGRMSQPHKTSAAGSTVHWAFSCKIK